MNKTEAQRIFKISIREFLTWITVLPYLGWSYLIAVGSRSVLGNYCILDIIFVVFMGVCIFSRYIKRDKNETITSRIGCVAAAFWAMFIGLLYTSGVNFGAQKLFGMFQIQITGLVPILTILGVKAFSIFRIYILIDPFGTKIVSSCYEDYDILEEDDDDEDEETVVA